MPCCWAGRKLLLGGLLPRSDIRHAAILGIGTEDVLPLLETNSVWGLSRPPRCMGKSISWSVDRGHHGWADHRGVMSTRVLLSLPSLCVQRLELVWMVEIHKSLYSSRSSWTRPCEKHPGMPKGWNYQVCELSGASSHKDSIGGIGEMRIAKPDTLWSGVGSLWDWFHSRSDLWLPETPCRQLHCSFLESVVRRDIDISSRTISKSLM